MKVPDIVLRLLDEQLLVDNYEYRMAHSDTRRVMLDVTEVDGSYEANISVERTISPDVTEKQVEIWRYNAGFWRLKGT